MRVRLTESEIRGIVRRRIVSQLLAEGNYDDALPDVDTDVEPFALGGAAFATGEEGDDEGDEARLKQEMQKSGEETVESIARLVGLKQAEWGADGPTIGPETGAAIKKHIDGMKLIRRPFIPRNPNSVLSDWVDAASNGDIDDIEYEGGTLRMTPDVKGLLAYIFALTVGEYGTRITMSDLSGTKSFLETTVDPAVSDIRDAIGKYTTIENLRTVAEKLEEFVSQDKTKKMIGTKLLLAAFAHENTTFREGLKPVGYVAAIATAVALFVMSGGWAALGGATGTGGSAYLSGLGLTASSGAALTAAWAELGILGAIGATTGLIAAGTAATWGVTEAADLMLGSDAAIIKSYTNQYEQLDELANEVERTIFATSYDREKRDDLARIIRMIYAYGADADRQSVVSDLRDWNAE